MTPEERVAAGLQGQVYRKERQRRLRAAYTPEQREAKNAARRKRRLITGKEELLRHTERRRAKRVELAGRPKPDNCECCDAQVKLVWDHNHAAGSFRGWICGPCNLAVGIARDNPERLRLMAAYLERTKDV